jgi:hypothetical protein
MLFGKASSVEDLQNEWRNPYLQWYAAGMPAFNTGDLSPYKQIKVKFKTMEDRQAFSDLLGYSLTEKTAVVWYPEKGREKNNMNRIVEDE